MVKSFSFLSKIFLILSLLTGYVTCDEQKKGEQEQTSIPKQKPKAKPHSHENPLFESEKESFIAEGNFLYWNLLGGDTAYLYKTKTGEDGATKSTYASIRNYYNPGMRFKIGYYRAKNFWEATVDYTLIHFHGESRAKSDEVTALSSLFTQDQVPLISAKSTLFTSYKNLNVLASRVFLPYDNPHLRLRLDGGIDFVWMRQLWDTTYRYEEANKKVDNDWKYWGGGFRCGLIFDWFWGDNIYFTGKFSPALVCGKLHQNLQVSEAITSSSDYDDYRLSFNVQFSLGPSYQKNWSKGRFEIFAGYELEMWTNVWEVSPLPSFSPSRQITHNLFSMQGLTSRITLYF